MGDVAVSGLAHAHPGGELLFSDVSFRVPAGRHAALVGVNGVGKSTLMSILAGERDPLDGAAVCGGRIAYMAQDVGTEIGSVRELLLMGAPARVRDAGQAMLGAERALAEGDMTAGGRLGEAIGLWSDLGGYELEGHWDVACRRIVGSGLAEVSERPAATLSGGERKRLVLSAIFAGEASVLLLDEPDNFLDIPSKRALEQDIKSTRKTVLVISHDRELLSAASNMVVTLEGNGAWVHGESYESYRPARQHRQQLLGDRLLQYRHEERRLFEIMKRFKQRARYAPAWAKRADAAQTRWRRFKDVGPPPAPVLNRQIRPRLRGGDSARRVVALRDVEVEGLIDRFSEEVYFGERVGLIGPNGTGKTSLMRLLAGEDSQAAGEVVIGSRVSPGLFTQLNSRAEFSEATVLEVATRRTGATERAMNALARYELHGAARQACTTLSGGQRARLEILCLELEGHNLLLLDEPTDNIDTDSAEALEEAFEEFEGTIVAVSHDRVFLRSLDRFLLFDGDGSLRRLGDSQAALRALSDGVAVS